MSEEYLSRCEHDEFTRRMEQEHERQNSRIKRLEEQQDQITELAMSVNKLAVNMDGMLRELEAQGGRLKTLEARDGEMWRKVIGAAVTVIVGAVLGFAASKLGF